MRITKDTVATLEYRLTDGEGTLIDTSDGRGPLTYVHGTGNLIPGLEAELEGKQGGDRLQVAIPPEQGYGPRDEGRIHSVSRDQLPAEIEPQVGMQLRAESAEGVQILTVVGVEDGRVRVDGNHPLAGVTLHFDVTVVEVRDATAEELAHGHVHGPGGHAH